MKTVKHNIVQHLHSATLDSATVNSATSKSATKFCETLNQCNINCEIRNKVTLIGVILNRAT